MDKATLQRIMIEYRSIGSLERRIAALRETLERITPQLDGMPHGSDGKDKMATLTATIVDLEEKLDKRRVNCEVEMQRAETVIDTLPDQQRLIMRLRYIDGLTWRQVSEKSNYDKRHCIRIHKRALERIK